MKFSAQTRWYILAAGLLLVFVRGLFIPVMDVDASQYASISMEMLQNGSWLEVLHRHTDYLDKPPLLFWLSAFSMKIFGIHTAVYKLPSVLMALLGVYAVGQFTRMYYSVATARSAVAILATSVGLLLLCNDVRTDTLLMGASAVAIWQMAAFHREKHWKYLLGAAIMTGMAMLAKGPVGLIAVMAATGAHLALRREWSGIFRWEWLAGMAVIVLMLVPMSVGLYQQFDVHPEKVINGRTDVSGLYFYFWEQSFGRITGENVWKNDTTVFNFLHVYAWAFLPWSLLLLMALGYHFRQLVLYRFRLSGAQEGFSLGAFVLLFLALSLSKYKLPHYIFITLPWAAVLTARWLHAAPPARWWGGVQMMVQSLATLAVLLIPAWVFFTWNPAIWLPALALAATGLRLARPRYFAQERYVQGVAFTGLLIGFVLNFHYYPQLLPFQSTVAAGRFFVQQHIPVDQRIQMGGSGHALDFYSRSIIPRIPDTDSLRVVLQEKDRLWMYEREGARAALDTAGIPYTVVAGYGHFQVALMKPGFLNPATRAGVLQPATILEVRSGK